MFGIIMITQSISVQFHPLPSSHLFPMFTCPPSSVVSLFKLRHRRRQCHSHGGQLFLGDPSLFLPGSAKSRCVFDPTSPPRCLVVSSSLASVFTSAAASGSGSGSAHAAVASAITQVAVAAVAIASGACLSTKVDFLTPKAEEQPGSVILDGVDVTGCSIFNDAKVQKAVAFARRAHHGQFRKTGDPYLAHCLHTGRILAMVVPSSGKRAVDTIVAGILHDVVDDTSENLRSIEEGFGEDVAKLVAGVSRLSYLNELLRRRRRINMNQGNIGHEEANKMQVMLVGMVDDPRVVLIKLADRLHNMRTIYALPTAKAQAVAQETLVIWCSLASRLGLWALKAELEDLCFAVLQPLIFRQMRADLASMWSHNNKSGKLRKIYPKSSFVSPLLEENTITNCERSVAIYEDPMNMKDLVEAVLPFEVLLDRKKRTSFLSAFGECLKAGTIPKIVRDAGIALEFLVVCEEALEQELLISTSYIPGMEVTLSSRLKSLYSIHNKMKRKDVGINKVYDARALRVVVGDKNGTLHGPAIECCYSLLNIVHKLWTPIDGEFDDYIVNPKPSGYQSLHTAVQCPDSMPLEVQIRTQRMHEYAEYGLAAHWLYKETENKLPPLGNRSDFGSETASFISNDLEGQSSSGNELYQMYRSLKAGHPILRVEGSHLLAAVVVRVDKGGRELLVAVSFGLAPTEAVADRRSGFQTKQWDIYARLYKKVSEKWWFEPGHGDWFTCLEKYTLCRDGLFHKEDQYQRLLSTFIQVINLTEQEEFEYWAAVSAVFEGKEVASILPSSFYGRSSRLGSSTSMEANINNKVHLLRTMLQWEEQLWSEAGIKEDVCGFGQDAGPESILLSEVVVVCWPHGHIMKLGSGSTAADAASRMGHEGKLVLINGQLVLPDTELKDGDIVEVRA